MRNKVILLFCLLFLGFIFSVSGQRSRKSSWIPIYSDPSSGMQLEIQFKTLKDSCGDGSTPTHSFSYKLTSPQNNDFHVAWKMNYLDCDGRPYCQERSIDLSGKPEGRIEDPDYLITASAILDTVFNAEKSYVRRDSNKPVELEKSLPPSRVVAESINYSVKPGSPVSLRVIGGVLGKGAKWTWYRNLCGGQPFNTGEKITDYPTDTTVYFVRAEGTGGNTPCVFTVVNVDFSSDRPKRIMGRDTICNGDANILRQEGGVLGYEATWHWYENDPKTNYVHEGEEYSVSPTTTTTYYVKAVNKKHPELASTDPVSFTVHVMNSVKENSPRDILFVKGTSRICEGESIMLEVEGGVLPDVAAWHWKSGSPQGIVISKGIRATLSPKATTTYFVNAKGYCDESLSDSVTVSVDILAKKPSNIGRSTNISGKGEIILKPVGGEKGSEGIWEWYRNDTTNARYSSADFIEINPRKQAEYFVRAISKCNTTGFVSDRFEKATSRAWDRKYIIRDQQSRILRNNKFLEIGFGLGFDASKQSALGINTITYTNGSPGTVDSAYDLTMSGIGFIAEFTFHPIIKEYFSLGFTPNVAIGGYDSYYFQAPNSNQQIRFNYFRYILRGEMAIGSAPIKLLFAFNSGAQTNNFKSTGTDNSTLTYNGTDMTTQLSAGLRLGRYGPIIPRVRHGSNIDLLYSIRKPEITSMNGKIKDWYSGLGFTWWRHSVLKLRAEWLLPTNHETFIKGNIDFTQADYRISFIFNGNWFY